MGLIAGALGCDDDFGSRTVLDSHRVLGVAADRPEVGPDDTVTLQIFDVEPGGGPVTYRWSVCLQSLGADTNYACVDPALETALEGPDGTATLDLGPSGIGFRATYPTLAPYVAPGGEPLTLADGVDLWVFVESGPQGGVQQRTVRRIRVREGEEAFNQNPGVEGMAVERLTERRLRLRALVEPGASEPYRNRFGETDTEALLFTWYTTAGTLDPGLTVGAIHETTLTLPAGVEDADVYVAVRDGRGGLTVVDAQITASTP